MSSLVRTLACAALVLGAGMAAHVPAVADDRAARNAQWAEAAARQAQEAQRRQREARLRWEYERSRSAAHARMPNTLYASTPSSQATADLSCPALVDEDTRRLYRGFLEGRRGNPKALNVSGMVSGESSRNAGINVFPVRGQDSSSSPSWQSAFSPKADSPPHLIQASGWTPAAYRSKSATEGSRHVYLFPSASEPLREGFVRVINHSTEAGEVTIDPVDDSGRQFDTITLPIDASEAVHFNSGDLETGNEGKGLSGSTGSGQGDWRLAFSSDLDIEVLSYIRTEDGFLTAMHDVAPVEGDIHQVAIFNPGSNRNQVSRLRLINPTDATAEVTIRGTDDKGMPGSGEVSLSLDAGTTREITAEQLESGGTGLAGMLGDGSGKWRLQVESEQAVVAMSLLESPTDHLTNLSTVPELPEDGVHGVPLFPAAGDDSGRQGFVRAINRSDTAGEIHIKAYDETERDYEAVTLAIGGNEVVHFNSDDLEQGSPQKGLSGGTGAGEGDWRLELTSDLQIEVLSYIRTTDGFLTAMHDVAPSAGNRHRVAVFNPGSNRNQESLLRLVNPGEAPAEVTIAGVDDRGAPGDGEVMLSVPGGGSRTVGAWELESGAEGLTGMLGDGSGKWQLTITSDLPVVAMSLLKSPTGHLTNLSTAPVRGAEGGAIGEPLGQTAEEVFQTLISGPIVQTKCINCHVEGGASANTRLVFVDDTDPDHEAINLQVFQDFLAEVDDGAGYILNKIQGALAHGGGAQVVAGTEEYAGFEGFMELLGAEVETPDVTVSNLFDGVKMESWRSTLRRAAIVFAGRIPTAEEYAAINGGTGNGLRAAIRGLMRGPEFHEFLIRASNDRLLTDRRLGDILMGAGRGLFVDFTNELHRLTKESGAIHPWYNYVHFGAGRAPLELIAHVVENDLPYTEILTADYIMANPMAAKAYGASTAFDDPDDVHEFKPSRIVSYYRDCDGKVVEDTEFGGYIANPGPCATDYPHAGVLNTNAFLARYPTTATNRNRARSRWTYYHFLGIDVEKSASRTTDPAALADTNNPTLSNPACTVCHSVLDPVAGTFQNYGDESYYRDQGGGLDSLDGDYKGGKLGLTEFAVEADKYESRQTFSLTTNLDQGSSLVIAHPHNNGCGDGSETCGRDLRIDELVVLDLQGGVVDRVEWSELDAHCEYDGQYNEGSGEDDHYQWWGWECGSIPVEVPKLNSYVVEITVWADQAGGQVTRFELGTTLYREGDTWYRDMRPPSFDGRFAPNADNSVQWLAEQIVADQRFSEATVRFWWPAVMGSEIAEPPADEGDADFEGRLLASNAQTAEAVRLASGFRRGFRGRSAYDLKDLLVEVVLSKWFRADSLTDDDPVRAVALADAAAKRLLTPEELARKTGAVIGFQWGRWFDPYTQAPWEARRNHLTSDHGYRMLYGGIDSDGVTERARDLTSTMIGVASAHASAVSCPVVERELYLLPDRDRRLFAGIEKTVSPVFEFGDTFEIEAQSRSEIQTLSMTGHLPSGEATVALAHGNSFFEDSGHGHRGILLDRLIVRRGDTVVYEYEMEQLNHPIECHHLEQGAFHLSTTSPECVLRVPVDIPLDGTHEIEVLAWADRAGNELAKLEIAIESDAERSAGGTAIRNKLAELYDKLMGVDIDTSSHEVDTAYRLFVDVWNANRDSGQGGWFDDGRECDSGTDLFYYDGLLDDALVLREDENGYMHYAHDWDRIGAFREEVDWSDTRNVARTWVVVLAYLLTDYRYLYL